MTDNHLRHQRLAELRLQEKTLRRQLAKVCKEIQQILEFGPPAKWVHTKEADDD